MLVLKDISTDSPSSNLSPILHLEVRSLLREHSTRVFTNLHCVCIMRMYIIIIKHSQDKQFLNVQKSLIAKA